jgi:hypothetical protein
MKEDGDMMKYKVSSGEFELIVVENSLLEAANVAIQLHDARKHRSKLGDLTLVEELTHDVPNGEHLFIGTKGLIEKNTQGFGDNLGQYTRE